MELLFQDIKAATTTINQEADNDLEKAAELLLEDYQADSELTAIQNIN